MISFFPSPYPDELWYSVICRYYVHSGNSCAKHTMRQLYGDNFSAPSLMLCGAINTLLAQPPQGFLSAKDVVMQHTFFPYYARFFPTQRKRSTYAYAVNGNPAAVHRMGISQANGNHCSAMRYCPVCYLDLEDGDADLQERIKKLNMGEEAPAGLLYSTEAPTLADGLLDTLNQTLSSNPSIKLIVIDTLGVVLGAQNSDSNQFAQEYALYGSLKKVANAHSIALLVIHHLRKTGDDNNPFNRIYGGVATQAALDTMMVLEKDTHASDSAHLHVSGRRCPQQDFVLSFDADTCIWSMVGNSAEADEKFHRNQYERSEAVVTIKEAVASGNGSWSGSMSDLSRMAETIPCIGHGLGHPRSLSNEVNHFKNDLCRYDGITITIAKNGTGGRKYTFSKATH